MSAGLGMPSLLLAGITLLVAPVAAQPGIAQSDRKGAPELVTSGEYPAVRHVVAHAHRMPWFGCFGYLYFSRDKVRYEVVHPQRSKEHSFELPRSALKQPHRWTTSYCLTFDFSTGGKYHFCHLSKEDMEAGKFTQVLPYQDLVDSATKFEDVLAKAQAREERRKPPPAAPPTLSLLEPSGAAEGKMVEASGKLLRVRGVASHASGIASVSVNGQVAYGKPLAPQTVEFDARDLPLSAGTNAVVVLATATDRATGQMIFRVAKPEVRVLDPVPGFETLEATLRVRGVATGFREIERIEIAGVRASLRRREDGSTEFEAESVPLNLVGVNTLEGSAVGTSGARETFKVEVKRKPPAGSPRFTLQDIVDMLQGEIAPARIANLVAERGVDFALTDAAEMRLRTAGADDALLLAITKGKK